MNWLNQELADVIGGAETRENAIMAIAEDHFREHGASDNEACHLNDQIFIALWQCEKEEAFARLSSAVERAFNRLRINGYRCEQNWQCCRSCGWAAIPDEDASHAVWYHSQDRDHGLNTGELWFVWDGDPGAIREAFEAEGLSVTHDGTHAQRIMVKLEAAA